MFLKVGTSYTFPIGAADLNITREVLTNEADQPYATRDRWASETLLVGTSAVDIDAKVALLYAAFNSNGKDFRLTMPNGTTNSQHVLLNSGSITGTLIRKRPSVTTFAGAGGVTNIRCTWEVEAEYPISNSASLLRSFEETLSIDGGGSEIGYLKPLYGFPQAQTLRRNDSYRAVQQGSAVGIYGRPDPLVIAPPIFAGFQLRAPKISMRSPRRRGLGNEDFAVSWLWEYESASPLVGEPNQWI